MIRWLSLVRKVGVAVPNMTMSRGCAVIFEGLKVNAPFSPTLTVCTTGVLFGVGSGEPGYEPYVVVQVLDPNVIV